MVEHKEPMSREEAVGVIRGMIGRNKQEAYCGREMGLDLTAGRIEVETDALQYLLDYEEPKTMALERIRRIRLYKWVDRVGWRFISIDDLQSIAEAALETQEPQKGESAAAWSHTELLTLNDLIDHAKDYSAESASTGRTAEAGCWRTTAQALTQLREGRATLHSQEGESAK